MYKKDYLLRIIEEVVKIIGKILGLIKERDFDKAEKLLNESYQLIEIDREYNDLPVHDLIKKMEMNEISYKKMEAVADLIKVEGDLQKAEGKTGFKDYYLKALAIYDYLERNDTTYSFERANKIDNMHNIIDLT